MRSLCACSTALLGAKPLDIATKPVGQIDGGIPAQLPPSVAAVGREAPGVADMRFTSEHRGDGLTQQCPKFTQDVACGGVGACRWVRTHLLSSDSVPLKPCSRISCHRRV